MSSTISISRPRFFSSIVVFRALWFVLSLVGLNSIIPLGTPVVFASIAATLGVYAASLLAHSRLNNRGFFSLLALMWLIPNAGFWLIDLIFSGGSKPFLLVDQLRLHTESCVIVAGFAAAATWIFWRFRIAVVLEVFAFLGAALITFAAHRDLHLDRPRIINTIAWRLGVDHLTMLLIIGSTLLIAAGVYLFMASRATRSMADKSLVQWSPSPASRVPTIALLLSLIALILLVQKLLYGHFFDLVKARIANGVGMGSEQGVSPLSFQSALGSTNQPAGLVRLEGDYTENPFTPMMYLRESALSSFSGREMVFAGRAYDTDLPVIKPQDSFTGKEDADLNYRTPVTQSLYLLADHENAFALDYPLSIVQLKNPKPGRFKSTYRTYSLAPAFKLSEISSNPVGDPRWSPEVRAHYLVPHPDKRYEELARQLTREDQPPVDKILGITNYLSRTAIYTLTPNHNVDPNADPVAPFLFGDHRGYCVHFAHAITYMARSIGIPARIGTGYLTDLSQAKDGHILLRMSDRHAWAEVYLTGIGWVPFDVQPEQVESHADTQIDSKLLEELMGILEPGEEILPPDSVKDEVGMNDPAEDWIPDTRQARLALYCILGSVLLLKLLLLLGWKLAPSSKLKLRWGYVSLASRLYDIGISRDYGETRSEFAARTPERALEQITRILLSGTYSSAGSRATSKDAVNAAMRDASSKLRLIPIWKRALGILNPASVFSFIWGRRW